MLLPTAALPAGLIPCLTCMQLIGTNKINNTVFTEDKCSFKIIDSLHVKFLFSPFQSECLAAGQQSSSISVCFSSVPLGSGQVMLSPLYLLCLSVSICFDLSNRCPLLAQSQQESGMFEHTVRTWQSQKIILPLQHAVNLGYFEDSLALTDTGE